MSFFTEYDELFEKNKSIRSKIEELKFTGLTVLSVYDDKYIETKIIPYTKNQKQIARYRFIDFFVSDDKTQSSVELVHILELEKMLFVDFDKGSYYMHKI